MTAKKCAEVVIMLIIEKEQLLKQLEDVTRKIEVNEHLFDFNIDKLREFHFNGETTNEKPRKKK